MKTSLQLIFALTSVLALAVSACAPAIPAVTETTAPTEGSTEAPTEMPLTESSIPGIGSPEHPIKILLAPFVDAEVITAGGEGMAKTLNDATGLSFDVGVLPSYAAAIEEMCASPSDTLAFLPGLGYAFANQLCGVDIAFKAVLQDYPVYWSMFIVRRSSKIQTLQDLNGKKWGYGDAESPSGYLVPLVMMKTMGITPGEKVPTGGHLQTVAAVYNGEVDFGTVFYRVPLNPSGTPAFTYQDVLDGKVTEEMYEVPAEAIPNCAPDLDGKRLLCDGWRVLDARANVRTDFPDVMQKVRILAVSPAIPNDTVSFGPELPEDIRAQVEQALMDFSKTEAWANSIGSSDFYGWKGIEPATDAEYDFIRQMVSEGHITIESFR